MNRQQWQKRYDNPVRMSLTPGPEGAWDHERLFVPEIHAQKGHDVSTAYDQHMELRQAQIRGSQGTVRERAELMERAERAGMQHYTSAELAQGLSRTSVGALEARQDLMERERSMTQLVRHDLSHGHPMAVDPQRSPESASWDEKRQWAERDGRQLDHEERVTLGQNGAFDPFRERQQRNAYQQQGAGEQLASFALGSSPEPITAVAAFVSASHTQEPVRRSGLMDMLDQRQQQRQEKPQPEASPEQAVKRSSLMDKLIERAASRPAPVRAPEHEHDQGLSMGR